MQCIAEGHDIIALANLRPKDKRKFINNTVPEMWYGEFVCRPIFSGDHEEIFWDFLQNLTSYIPNFRRIGQLHVSDGRPPCYRHVCWGHGNTSVSPNHWGKLSGSGERLQRDPRGRGWGFVCLIKTSEGMWITERIQMYMFLTMVNVEFNEFSTWIPYSHTESKKFETRVVNLP